MNSFLAFSSISKSKNLLEYNIIISRLIYIKMNTHYFRVTPSPKSCKNRAGSCGKKFAVLTFWKKDFLALRIFFRYTRLRIQRVSVPQGERHISILSKSDCRTKSTIFKTHNPQRNYRKLVFSRSLYSWCISEAIVAKNKEKIIKKPDISNKQDYRITHFIPLI